MSKQKKRGQSRPDVEREAGYYDLKSKAVDDLVNANEENSPPVSEEELRQYLSGPKLKTAGWVKLLFIKFWFPAAVCFFFMWGLGNYLADMLDTLLVTGMALGIVTDLLTNNVLRFFEKTPGANDRWMMFPKKGYISFPLNILYGYFVLFFVFLLYTGINAAAAKISGDPEMVFIGVEPILFGLFYTGFDMLFIQIKYFLAGLFKKGSRP